MTRGRKPLGERAMTPAERQRARRERLRQSQPPKEPAKRGPASEPNSAALAAARAEIARLKAELAAKPVIDAKALSMTAQEKLEASRRQMERRLNAEHAARMAALDEVIRQRVLSEGKEYVAALDAMEAKAKETVNEYLDRINRHKPILSIDDFNLLRKCLHQNGIAAYPKDFNSAFDLINTRKLQLTGQR